jgi:GNAT superfamily N-acetyltransferase
MEEENIFTVQRPASPTDWETYHAIRKKNLFDPINIAYDPNHPSLKDPKNHHYLFLMDGQIIGTLQLETLLNDTCIIRTLAIKYPHKNKGYGTLLLSLAEEIMKEFECHYIHLHSLPNVVAFYEKSGYTRMNFPIDESTYPGTVDLGKVLQN